MDRAWGGDVMGSTGDGQLSSYRLVTLHPLFSLSSEACFLLEGPFQPVFQV